MKIANFKFGGSAANAQFAIGIFQFAICNRLAPNFVVFLISALAGSISAAPPKVNYLFPAGAQRGQTASVTASGEFTNWPLQVWADRPGLTATCEKDKGKLKVEIAAEAVPGTYWLRLYDSEGAAAMRPFVVGTLPEVTEDETNDLPAKPQAVDARVVINGRLAKSGDVDGYRVELKEGQTLVASTVGHSILGSPMDCVLQIAELVSRQTSSVSGSQPQVEAVVVAQNHDAVGLDPQLSYTAPRDGRYLVRVFAFPSEPDSSIRFAGGDFDRGLDQEAAGVERVAEDPIGPVLGQPLAFLQIPRGPAPQQQARQSDGQPRQQPGHRRRVAHPHEQRPRQKSEEHPKTADHVVSPHSKEVSPAF